MRSSSSTFVPECTSSAVCGFLGAVVAMLAVFEA